jgi:hypothetical protein
MAGRSPLIELWQLRCSPMDSEFQQFVLLEYGEEVLEICQQLLQDDQQDAGSTPADCPEVLLISALQKYRQRNDRLLHAEEARFFSYPQ